MANETQLESTAATVLRGHNQRTQLLILGLLMLGEAAAVFFVAKAIGGDPATAAAHANSEPQEGKGAATGGEFSEVELADCRPSNKMSGKFVTFHIRVSGLVGAVDAERVKQMAEAKQARILDRVNYVIRSAELQHLNEPGLETVKRRLKQEFDRVFGDEELIKEVLIPEMLQSGSGL